jgi:predicted 3-demethylubiquinone-9 3-methyltransferase (glyoxalase superfamily)
MKINYKYQEENQKVTDKVKMKIFDIKNYSCKFLAIDVETVEGIRKNRSGVMIGINSKKDIDELISKLKEMKKQF